ncbi:MAG: dihydropteroate synthase [Treponema sp.]|nr:dihydropteroate synthase [Treponema sp.]
MIKLKTGNKTISTERQAFIMGILNVTPDSFYEQSRGSYEKAMKLIEDGADILDIGGESTRPGFEDVPEDEEIERVIPLIEKIRKVSDIPVSLDTRKAKVLQAAVKEGIDIYNDVSAFDYNPESLQIASKNSLSVIIMNNQGKDIKSTNAFFDRKVKLALKNGVSSNRIILDPGIGFNKTPEENICLIRNAEKLGKGKYPVLMALSRKSCIGHITGRTVNERLAGTLTANIISVIKGCQILRVHDVKETLDALNVIKTVLS